MDRVCLDSLPPQSSDINKQILNTIILFNLIFNYSLSKPRKNIDKPSTENQAVTDE